LGVTVRWYDEAHTILLHELNGVWTREEFLAKLGEIIQLASTVNHKIDVISYSPPMANPPIDSNPMRLMQEAFKRMPKNVGYVVLTGGTLFLKTLGQAIVKVMRLNDRIQFALTIEEANRLILKLREKQ
jgi:hypothetical protein